MKDRIQPAAIIIMIMIAMNSRANVQFQPLSNALPSRYSFIGADLVSQVITASVIGDSLPELQKNYPPVYRHLLQEFKNAASLHYSVEGNLLLISFTSNKQKILTVYSTTGKFRHSIADIGLALPSMITEQLKKEYPAYSVYYGKEIRSGNKNMYQVVIENKQEYRLINFFDAEMEEIKKIKK